MKITKQGDKMIVEIDLFQHKRNPYDENEEKELTDNLIGIVADRECSISQLIDLSYKDDQQEGSPILMFNDEEELTEVCKKFNIKIWKHSLCNTCGKAIRGSFTMNEKGNLCWDCELHEKEKTINIT